VEVKEMIEMVAKELGLTMTAKFVPWSQSRNAGEKERSLNWKIAMLKDGKEFLTTDYMAGIGHCPSYKQGPMTMLRDKILLWECENGRAAIVIGDRPLPMGGKPILPELTDVIHSLCMDAEAIDHKSFSEWATDLDCDTDSIKAHETYKACLSIGLALRCALGDEGLAKLRRACENY
jgi:hypothetical protein